MALERPTGQEKYLDVLERVLEKGVVIDASVQVSLVGLEILRIDAWVVVASFDTYLRHPDLMKKIVGSARAGDELTGEEPSPSRETLLQPPPTDISPPDSGTAAAIAPPPEPQ